VGTDPVVSSDLGKRPAGSVQLGDLRHILSREGWWPSVDTTVTKVDADGVPMNLEAGGQLIDCRTSLVSGNHVIKLTRAKLAGGPVRPLC
jgi:hypothetical protein